MRWIGDQEDLVPFGMVGIEDGCGVGPLLFREGVLVLGPANLGIDLGRVIVNGGHVEGFPDVDSDSPFEVELLVVVWQICKYLVSLDLPLLQLLNIDRDILLGHHFE